MIKEFVKKWWPFKFQYFALNPDITQMQKFAIANTMHGAVFDAHVYMHGENITKWCEENLKNEVTWSYIQNTDKIKKICDNSSFGGNARYRKGLVLVRFTNMKDAVQFRLTFGHDITSL